MLIPSAFVCTLIANTAEQTSTNSHLKSATHVRRGQFSGRAPALWVTALPQTKVATETVSIASVPDSSKISHPKAEVPFFILVTGAGSPASFDESKIPDLKPEQAIDDFKFTYVKHDSFIIVLDREGLGFTFIENLADSFVEASKTIDPQARSKAIFDSVLPMIWSPYRAQNVTGISNLDLIPGYGLKLEKPGSQPKWFDSYDTSKPITPGGFNNVASTWKQGFSESKFMLKDMQLSAGGTHLPESKVLQQAFEWASQQTWQQFSKAKAKYNESIEILREKIMPGAFPFIISDSLEGKNLSTLPPEYNQLGLAVLDPLNPQDDWSEAKILKASQELYIRGRLQKSDGSVELFFFQLPAKIP